MSRKLRLPYLTTMHLLVMFRVSSLTFWTDLVSLISLIRVIRLKIFCLPLQIRNRSKAIRSAHHTFLKALYRTLLAVTFYPLIQEINCTSPRNLHLEYRLSLGCLAH